MNSRPSTDAGLAQAPVRSLGWLATFGLSAFAALAITYNAFAVEFHAARLAAVLAVILLMHVVRFARVVFSREALIYAAFLGYMLLQLLWTDDRQLALNTIVPAICVALILILYASLAVLHDLKAVLAGALVGFLAGAAAFSVSSGFPFLIPNEFSYNAIAGMYLFGLIVTLLLACVGRWKTGLFLLAVVIGAHIVATTSIKVNVGILLGALTVGAIHFGYISRLLWRNALVILGAAAVLTIAVASNEAAVKAVDRGADRVALGIEILRAREDRPGYTGFGRRADWQREGLRGWAENPVFGHGVEAFRARHGFTSHASHVDVAYNSGLVGLALFYGLFASMFLRLYHARHRDFRTARLVILGSVACIVFISFAGAIHYNAFMGASLALCIGILKRA